MGFESRAISARVTKQIVTIFSKTCDNRPYLESKILQMCMILTLILVSFERK